MGEAISSWRERLRTVLRNPLTEPIVKFALVPALLLCSLWLPPVSLGVRLFHTDYPLITAQGGVVGQEGGGRLAIAPGTVSGRLRLQLQTVDPADSRAAKLVAAPVKAVPAGLALVGPLYRLDAHGARPGEAIFTAPLPAELAPASGDDLDLYAWTGKEWQWVASTVLPDLQEIQATLTTIPPILATLQAQPQGLLVGVGATDVAAVNAAPLDIASDLYMAGLSLAEDGTVSGEIALDSAPAHLSVLPTLSNRVRGVARSDWVANLIGSAPTRTAHVKSIVEAVGQGGYGGLNLEYEGLDAELSDAFAAFVAELAADLHKAGKVLAVRVDEPRRNADGAWDAAGYDWPALGQAADVLRVPAINDPNAYGPGGMMEACLRALTRQVNRQKVQLIVSASCYEQVGDRRQALCYGDALSLASQALVAEGGNEVLPGETLAVQLPRMASGLREHAASGHVWFAFKDSGGVEHRIWLENASSVAHKLAVANQFHLRGVAIDDLAGTANDAQIWEAVRIARSPTGRGGAASASATGRYSVVWQVQSKDGQVVEEGVNPASQPVVNWTAVDDPGEYVISVAISEDGGKTTFGQPGTLEVSIPTPTPTPTPMPTPTPRPTSPPSAATAPVAAAPRPSSGVGFGYGIQVDMVTDTNYDRILGHVQAMGFGWVKQQIEWYRYNPGPGQYDWSRMDAIVDACAARGLKVLFSVVKAPNWARPHDDDKSVPGPPADPATYAEFVRQMAARYKGRVQAYEIWNEQNLFYEWGGKGYRLNAAKYVELLKPAYAAIKSVDTSATVISGALTPTGWSDGNVAIDDQLYLRQMYDAGLKHYCDAVGAHPSGYNNPPDADWRTWSDPTTSRAKGHPSWYFRATMEGYRNTMIHYGDGHKRIWPTEFGWATVEGLGVPPARGYEYAADNTAAEQGEFLVRAYQMGRNWGFVGPMFLWNLNFAPICGPSDEKAAFGIVDANWGPRPAFHALANMPK